MGYVSQPFPMDQSFSFAKVIGDLPRQPSCGKQEQGEGLCWICTGDNFKGISSAEFLRMENFPSKTDLGSNAFPDILKI